MSIMVVGQPLQKTYAAPFSPVCQSHGFLFQYENTNPPNSPPTKIDALDLVTNTLETPAPPPIDGRTVNAVGYNVSDHYMYGWDNKATPNTTLVRIHGDFTAEPLTVSGLPPGINIIPAGDVDNNGQYWFANPTDWFRVDLATLTHQGDGAIGLPGDVTGVLDWAYVPPTFANDNRGGLYTVLQNTSTNEANLYRFDISVPATPSWEFIGSLSTGMTDNMTFADGVVGALYADAYGVLYAGSNNGKLWRIIIGNAGLSIPLDAFSIADGLAANGNDGARCANAYYPVDFGDAPLSYVTNWDQSGIGPAHAVGNYNDTTNTAPLMLGTKIDLEPDGFPGASAKGDDNNDVADEESVQHIVAPPTPVALKVPVTVTNTSSMPATLAGWIDLDSSGTFDAGERVIKDIPPNSNTAPYELTFPTATLSANTFARFRLFQGTGLDDSILQPNGLAGMFSVGEVEDHLVQVGSFTVNKTADPPEGSMVSPGQTLTYTLNIRNTGSTDLDDLTVHDDLSNVLDDATLEGTPVVDPGTAGTATVNANTLEFKGDVPTGQTVTVTYKVKVKPADQIQNGTMQNYVIAAQSNCHPTINGQTVTVDHPDCNTGHDVHGLANTGSNIAIPIVFAGGLISVAGVILHQNRKRQRQPIAAK